MANEQHLKILKRGVEEWNRWREEYSEVLPDLSSAGLHGAGLHGANLSHAYLFEADLGGADLRAATLSHADLRDANLRGADLRGADLGNTNFGGADLGSADLGSAFAITQLRIEVAFGNAETRIPASLERPKHWAEARSSGSPFDFLLIWDPDAISEDLYADLVEALGNVVRSSGGAGLIRTREQPVSIGASVGVRT